MWKYQISFLIVFNSLLFGVQKNIEHSNKKHLIKSPNDFKLFIHEKVDVDKIETSYFEDQSQPLTQLQDGKLDAAYYCKYNADINWFSKKLVRAKSRKKFTSTNFQITNGIKTIIIYNGLQTDKNIFKKKSRVKRLGVYQYIVHFDIVDSSDLGSFYIPKEFWKLSYTSFNLTDTLGPQFLKMDEPVIFEKTNNFIFLYLVFVIEDIYQGTEDRNVYVSEMNYQNWDNIWESYYGLPINGIVENVAKINALIDSMD